MDGKERKQRIVLCVTFFSVGALSALTVSGVLSKETETKTIVETVTETKFVYKTIYKESERKEEKKDISKEKVVERRIAVPCKCPSCDGVSKQKSFRADSGLVWKAGELSFELPEGYYVIEEKIGEKELDKTFSSSEMSVQSIAEGKAKERSDSSEEVFHLEKQKSIDWIIGASVGYSFGGGSVEYGVNVQRRIIGPIYIGLSGSLDGKLHSSLSANASVGF